MYYAEHSGGKKEQKTYAAAMSSISYLETWKKKKFRMIKRSCLVLNQTQIQKTINYYFNQMTNTYDELYLVYQNQTWTHLNCPKISNVEPYKLGST